MSTSKTACLSATRWIGQWYGPIALGVILCLVYAPTGVWMWDRWSAADSYYSHGVLVPLVSGVIVYMSRRRLAAMSWSGSAWGLSLLAIGALMQVVSAFGRIHFLSGCSLLPLLAGLVVYIAGWRVLRVLAFPIIFLFFMVPMPLMLIHKLNFSLKMFASGSAVTILDRFMGLAINWEGSKVHFFGGDVLVVDDVCSGLRSLVSLVAFAALYAYFSKVSIPKRGVLLLAAVPLAVVCNIVRITVLCLVASRYGSAAAGGWVHDVSGYAVFLVALVLLFGLEVILRAIPGGKRPARSVDDGVSST